jgi:hypothetical protein
MVFRGRAISVRAFLGAIVQSLFGLMNGAEAWIEKLSKVRLRGGVVGKIATVLVMACPSIAAVAWAAHNVWISLICVLLLFALCFPLLWRLVTFAERNPYAALFEGAELLAHERLRLGTKETPILPSTPPRPPDNVPPSIEDTPGDPEEES